MTIYREWLIRKFEEIKRRTQEAIEQLDESQLNAAPDVHSHNIPALLRHIEGNMKERIAKGIRGESITRDREREFAKDGMSREEALALIGDTMDKIVRTVAGMTEAQFEETQVVRGRERTHLDMLLQCAAHYSEHMGQILYIAKQHKQESYQSTSV